MLKYLNVKIMAKKKKIQEKAQKVRIEYTKNSVHYGEVREVNIALANYLVNNKKAKIL
jgi:hypothetical protein